MMKSKCPLGKRSNKTKKDQVNYKINQITDEMRGKDKNKSNNDEIEMSARKEIKQNKNKIQ